MRRRPLDVRALATSITLGAVILAGWAALLGALAQPKDLKARLAAVDRQLTQAERLARASGDAAAFPEGTVCAAAGPGADALKRRIETSAAAASVALTDLAVTPAATDDASGQLTPIRLELQASGKHEAIVAMLAALDRDRPTLFVETADLKPQAGGAVNLKLIGRVQCWTSAHP
jgi:hypothetical protein